MSEVYVPYVEAAQLFKGLNIKEVLADELCVIDVEPSSFSMTAAAWYIVSMHDDCLTLGVGHDGLQISFFEDFSPWPELELVTLEIRGQVVQDISYTASFEKRYPPIINLDMSLDSISLRFGSDMDKYHVQMLSLSQ